MIGTETQDLLSTTATFGEAQSPEQSFWNTLVRYLIFAHLTVLECLAGMLLQYHFCIYS